MPVRYENHGSENRETRSSSCPSEQKRIAARAKTLSRQSFGEFRIPNFTRTSLSSDVSIPDGISSCDGEQRPPSRTDSVKTLCYDAEDYESFNSLSLPEDQSLGNAGNPFDANFLDFNPAVTSARLNRFIRQHYLSDSVSVGQAVPEGYKPLKPAASIRPSNEPAPGCQHFV